MGGLTVLLRPLNLIATVVLARLLEPSDFGLVALAMVLLSTSHLFTGLGLGAAVVHSPFTKKQIAFPAFVITLVMGGIFYGLFVINATFLASLLGSTDVIPVLIWLSALILFNALNLVPHALLRKELMFRQVSAIMAVHEVVYLIGAMGLAYWGFGVWSLVYAQLVSKFIRTFLVWLFTPGWDWLIPQAIDLHVTRSLTSYGLKTFGSGLTSYFHSNWDDWLVGRMLGDASLGFYSKAYQFSNKTLGRISQNTVGTVFFSTYVKLRGDEAGLRRVYLKSVEVVLALMVPISLGMALLAPQLVAVVFGPKWLPMATTLQIFSLVLLSRPISENSAPFFQALGRPEYNMRAGILLLLIMVPLAVIMMPWGISGIALAVTLSHFAGAAYNIYQTETLISGIARPTLNACGLTYLTGLIMVSGVYGANVTFLASAGLSNTVLGLLLSVAIGGLLYGIGLFFLKRALLYELLNMSLGRIKLLNRLLPQSVRRDIVAAKT